MPFINDLQLIRQLLMQANTHRRTEAHEDDALRRRQQSRGKWRWNHLRMLFLAVNVDDKGNIDSLSRLFLMAVSRHFHLDRTSEVCRQGDDDVQRFA